MHFWRVLNWSFQRKCDKMFDICQIERFISLLLMVNECHLTCRRNQFRFSILESSEVETLTFNLLSINKNRQNFNPFKPNVPKKGHWQTVKTQIRRRRTRRLIRVYTVYIKYRNFIKHGDNKNLSDTPYIGNEPVRRVKVEESFGINGLKCFSQKVRLDCQITEIKKKRGRRHH